MAQSPVENQIQIEIKKDSKQIFNFSHSFRPIYIVSRILGQMPFSIAYHLNGEIPGSRVTKLDVVWFIISSSIYIYATLLSSKCIYVTLEYNFTSTSTLGVVIIFASLLILGLLSIVFDMCCRLKFMDILNKFIIFDKKVKSEILTLNWFAVPFKSNKIDLLKCFS